MEHSPNIKLLIERLNLPKEQKKILENPPEIVKMTIDHLVSFSNKPRKKPPRIQNAWSIFLKNFGEYLRKTFPDETFPIEKISRMAAVYEYPVMSESLVQDNTQCSTQEVGPEHFSPEELNQLLQFIENDNINTDEMATFIPRPNVIGGYNGSTDYQSLQVYPNEFCEENQVDNIRHYYADNRFKLYDTLDF
nr:3764_t:CDS:2 [Entrophospora candida]